MKWLLTRGTCAMVLAWALASAASVWHGAAHRPQDPVVLLEPEFRALATVLPPSSAVGFLEYHEDDGRADRVRVHYVAQYALAPRLVLKRTDLEFLIVAPDAARPGGDDRLTGFVLAASSPGGYRLYRKGAP